MGVDRALEVRALGLCFLNLLFEEVGLIDGSVRHRVQQIADALDCMQELAAELFEGVSGFSAFCFSLPGYSGDDRLGALRRQQASHQSIKRQLIKFGLWDRNGETADAFPGQILPGTFVIAIGAALAGGHHQGLAAAFADGKAGYP